MRTQTIETVMTREYWEQNYRREYRRELRETYVSTCKGVLGIVIGAFSLYGIMAVIAIITEILCNIKLFNWI